MKVYIVLEQFDYLADTVHGVFARKESAQAWLEQLKSRDARIEECEVIP